MYKLQKIYVGCTQAEKTRVSLHKSNIKLPENRKLYSSKHQYEYSKGGFKRIRTYLTDD